MTKTYTNHKGVKSALKLVPKKGQIEAKDKTTVGLYLRIYSTGNACFVHRYKIKGTRRVYVFSDISLNKSNTEKQIATALAEARAKHAEQKAKMRQGIDPSIERDLQAKEIAAMPTVKAFAHIYIERYAKVEKKSWKGDKRFLDIEVIPNLGNLLLDQVKRSHVIAVLDKKQDKGSKVTRNRLLSLFSKYFNYAIERGHIEINPASGIKHLKEKSKERILTGDEVRYFWNKTDSNSRYNPATRLALRMVLVTGQRPGEVCKMQEDYLSDNIWTMPETKNGGTHSIPLTQMALDILDEARPHSRNGLLFSNTKDAVMDTTILPKLMKRMKWQDKNQPTPTPHDLRRTAITGISNLGYDRYLQDKIANHVDNSVGGIYDRNDYMDKKKEALEAWERKLQFSINNEQTDNVILFSAIA